MSDNRYCYPGTDILINKFGVTDRNALFRIETDMTFIRLTELQSDPIKGQFDFNHLKNIHKYIFQDLYDWAGQIRTVEIGKGNLFCTTKFIPEYAESVFKKYYSQCYKARNNKDEFIRVLASNYGDLNALHPFREGNGRAQREFARELCNACGYDFDLSATSYRQMLEASVLSFNTGSPQKFIEIFSKAVNKYEQNRIITDKTLHILSSDDLDIQEGGYDYYEYDEYSDRSELYNRIYQAKIQKMDAERIISDTEYELSVRDNANDFEKAAEIMDEFIEYEKTDTSENIAFEVTDPADEQGTENQDNSDSQENHEREGHKPDTSDSTEDLDDL